MKITEDVRKYAAYNTDQRSKQSGELGSTRASRVRFGAHGRNEL